MNLVTSGICHKFSVLLVQAFKNMYHSKFRLSTYIQSNSKNIKKYIYVLQVFCIAGRYDLFYYDILTRNAIYSVYMASKYANSQHCRGDESNRS